MGYTTAHLTECTRLPMVTTIISSRYTELQKEHSRTIDAKSLIETVQQSESDYYKELCKVIAGYDEVLLFGPTEGKEELYHILRSDRRCDHIKIVLLTTATMTEQEEQSFISGYYRAH